VICPGFRLLSSAGISWFRDGATGAHPDAPHFSRYACAGVAVQEGWIRLDRARVWLGAASWGFFACLGSLAPFGSRGEGTRLRDRCRYGEVDCVIGCVAVPAAAAAGARGRARKAANRAPALPECPLTLAEQPRAGRWPARAAVS